MSKKSRTKGKTYELEIVQKFKKVFPNAQRQLEYQEGYGVDIRNTGHLNIQCKRRKALAFEKWYKEVPRISKYTLLNNIPVLALRQDRGDSYVILNLDDFIEILQDIGIVYDTEV